LAEKLSKSFKIVNAYACNRQQPPIETLYRIAEILQVSVKDLLIEDKEKNSNFANLKCHNYASTIK
jgi:transcriptional regulator with XRE-family HTH domain